MLEFLPLAVSLAVSAIAVGGLNIVARRIGAVSTQTGDRWHMSGNIPHLAGPGILLAMLPWFPPMHGLVLAGFCVIGAIDDIRPLSALAKAMLMLLPSIGAGWITGEPWVAVMIWFVANAVNLLDHADGLAAMAVIAGFAFADSAGALAATGACIGFLIYNYPPARAFMGDGGSLMLGAGLVLVWSDSGIAVTVSWCLIPLADAVFVTLRRLVKRQKPWIGGKDHSGHILLRAGVPARLLPLVYGVVAAAAGFGGQALFVVG